MTNALLHPNTGVEREYEAIVAHEVENDSLAKVLEAGVKTTLGEFSARLLESKVLEQRVSIPKSLLAQNEDDDNLDKEGREVRTSIDDGGDEEEEVGDAGTHSSSPLLGGICTSTKSLRVADCDNIGRGEDEDEDEDEDEGWEECTLTSKSP